MAAPMTPRRWCLPCLLLGKHCGGFAKLRNGQTEQVRHDTFADNTAHESHMMYQIPLDGYERCDFCGDKAADHFLMEECFKAIGVDPNGKRFGIAQTKCPGFTPVS